ncbi:PLP-dependent aminotransferase family protein [Mucilaginibacter rigui]|uniref:PLP-dependent aminotransferase family protein n=1 Tax=Mucilaginibacter rigui TaxID=534635 RepID=A0ABR7X5S1_9SPHI|nr:PLP-dependent aminotransferase family protein [Mucilaginibacter rigui]MBD1385926.1 PLP-dependent aminotransferase family protein [Mucilaginibacter rigui]
MTHKAFRYEQVVNKIEEIIFGLQLQPGDKVPSVRKVSGDLKVSLTTVNQAYNILEAKGLISPRAKSGYYISSWSKNTIKRTDNGFLLLPEDVAVNTMATTMIRNTRKYGVINFSSLSPVNEFLPITRLNKALNAAMKDSDNQNFQYTFPEGHPALIKQISLHSMDWPRSLPMDEIQVTNGCMEAISLCLDAVTKAGDIVAIESPVYAGILQALESKGLKALGISVDPQTGINLDELELALNTHRIAAVICMPVCQNPMGTSMPEGNKIRLVNMLATKNIPLIEDDALGDLHFATSRPLPAKAYDEHQNVMYCSSFSKSLSPGFRIGWVSAGKYHSQVEKLKFAINISTNTLFQDTLSRYMENGHFNAHLKSLRANVQRQMVKYRNAILKYFPENISMSNPKGGYSLWLELPGKVNALDLQRQALRQGIGFCPGHIFSAGKGFPNFIRINCCPLWTSRIDDALKTLGHIVSSLS